MFIPIPNSARYAQLLYVPSAIGLGLSKALGASPFAAILTGRLTNLACYQLLGVLALCLAKRGRALLFCMLTLPTSLSMAGSFNLDGLVIATMPFSVALFSRSLQRRMIRRKWSAQEASGWRRVCYLASSCPSRLTCLRRR